MGVPNIFAGLSAIVCVRLPVFVNVPLSPSRAATGEHRTPHGSKRIVPPPLARSLGSTPSVRSISASRPQILQDLWWDATTRNKEMVAGAGASHIEQVALGVVDLLEI